MKHTAQSIKRYVVVLSALTIAGMAGALLCGCTSAYERKGNRAYADARNEKDEHSRRLLLKNAYIMYQKAVQARPEKIGDRLRNRFIEMTLLRADMVLHEGSYTMEAIPLYLRDIDSLLTPNVQPELKEEYAALLVELADSNMADDSLDAAIVLLDRAAEVSADPAPITAKKEAYIDSFTAVKLRLAEEAFKEGARKRDSHALVRCEYNAKLVLKYDPSVTAATNLLGSVRKKLVDTYSVYKMVVPGTVDPDVDTFDIFLAVQKRRSEGGRYYATVNMFNYSYNPQRIKPDNFYLVDTKGKQYPALPSSHIGKDLLDTEHEAKYALVFKTPSSPIRKLVYHNGEHYTEKYYR